MQETKKYHEYFSSETIDSLYKLWDEIGYNEEEKKIRLHRLVQRIQNVHSDFIEGTLRKCQNLTRKTNEIRDKHIKKLEALGASDDDIKHVKETEIMGTIKDKYIDTLNNYNEFLNIYNQRVDDFKKYYVQIQSCFKEIGIIDTIPQCCENGDELQNEEEEEESQEIIEEESQKEIEYEPSINSNENDIIEPNNASNENDDQVQEKDPLNDKNRTHKVSGYSNQDNAQSQGEFAQIGEDDLSLERLRRFENKAKELQNEVDIRFGIFNEIKTNILKLQSDLCEVSPPEIEELLNGHIYSDLVCDRLTDYQKYLSEIFETRKKYISEMAIEIVKLWDILDVDEETRDQFLQTHYAFSQKNVQDCIDEAERLTQMRNDRLPEIIEKMKKEISHICDDLSYSEEQKQQIFEKCDTDKLNEKTTDYTQDVQFYEENKELFIEMDDSKDEEGDKYQIEEEEEDHDDDEKSNNIDEDEEEKDGNIPLPEFEENVEETKNFIQIFNNYELELYRLKKIHLVAQPIIDSIKQRQEMIDEYNKLMDEMKQTNESSNKPSKPPKTKEKTKTKSKNKTKTKDLANSAPIKKKKNVDDDKRTDELNGQIELQTIRPRPPNSQDKIYQEKVIRRYKTVLPRLEKKLLIMLIQFREDNGEDFLWEQKPIINELKHIHVTQSEIRAQNKNRKKSLAQADSFSRITYNANAPSVKQRKSLEPAKQKIDVKSNKTRNQRKSTIPINPNKE